MKAFSKDLFFGNQLPEAKKAIQKIQNGFLI
jgi:hypothetical protein